MAGQRTQSVAKLCVFTAIKLWIFLSVAAVISGCDLLPRAPAPTAAEYCNVTISAAAADDVVLNVWAPDARQHCLRLYAPVIAAQKLAGISVSAIEKNVNAEPFRQLIKLATQSATAPDLAFFPNGFALTKLANDGYLHQLSACGLPESDWTNSVFRQRKWSFPFEMEALMLFYSKRILRTLGWDKARIDKLPNEIADGSFTLNDMITVARHAVEAGSVNKGFAITVHEQRFHSTMHLLNSFGGRLSSQTNTMTTNRKALKSVFTYYEQLRDFDLMHPAISQPGISNVSNRFSIRDALANGKILFAHTVVSEWKRMLLDHVQSESELQNNIGIALFPAENARGSAIMTAMGSYVIFSEKATGKKNQSQACEVLRSIANSDLHRQHATQTNQIAPEAQGIWAPSSLPSLTLENVVYDYQSHPDFGNLYDQINKMTARIALSEITAEQAGTLSVQQIQQTVQ